MILSIDIETFSELVLPDVGLYRYAFHPSFKILLFSYRIDAGPVITFDLDNGEEVPAGIVAMLYDPLVIKKAFNAQFEIVCLERWFVLDLPRNQWQCVMIHAAMAGLPMNLADAGRVVGVADEKKATGKQLIRLFCIPCKPSKANGMRTRNRKEHFPEKWAEFKEYVKYDVLSEDQVEEGIAYYDVPEREREFWVLDQDINTYGIEVDPVLIRNAIAIDAIVRKQLLEEAAQITGLDNPNSVTQLKEWLELEIDERVSTLNKKSVHALIKDCDIEVVKRVLRIRQKTSKSSIKKYAKALQMMGSGNRIRGSLQLYGASRTGRHAGRGVQPHNFPKNTMKGLEVARDLVLKGDTELLQVMFNNVPDVLSQLLRTMFVAGKGKTFLMADFKAIEARVIAWLAQEKWRLDVFKTHGKIYEASASMMFKVPIEQVTKGSVYRDKGKISELALGFQGGVGALLRMGAEEMGLDPTELLPLVLAWRAANPNIVNLWYAVQNAAIEAVRTGKSQKVAGCMYFMKNNTLFCRLPSGRCLSYLRPELRPNQNGYDSLFYFGIDQTSHQWKLIPTYGGKLVENIVQAIARDLLREKMFEVTKEGYRICFHVHDEIVIESPVYRDPHIAMQLKNLERIMAKPVLWAPGLPLGADAYSSPFYRKEE